MLLSVIDNVIMLWEYYLRKENIIFLLGIIFTVASCRLLSSWYCPIVCSTLHMRLKFMPLKSSSPFTTSHASSRFKSHKVWRSGEKEIVDSAFLPFLSLYSVISKEAPPSPDFISLPLSSSSTYLKNIKKLFN